MDALAKLPIPQGALTHNRRLIQTATRGSQASKIGLHRL